MSAIFRWSLLSGGRKDRFDCRSMTARGRRSHDAGTCIMVGTLVQISRCIEWKNFFMFANLLFLTKKIKKKKLGKSMKR